MVFRNRGAGAEDEGEGLVHDRIVFSRLGLVRTVLRHAVAEFDGCQDLSKRSRVVVGRLVPHFDLTRFHVGRDAVLLTARGRGTLGVRVRVVAYRDKPERCVLHKLQVVEGRLVRVEGVRREAVTLECKLTTFLSCLCLQDIRFSSADLMFSSYLIRHAVAFYHGPV